MFLSASLRYSPRTGLMRYWYLQEGGVRRQGELGIWEGRAAHSNGIAINTNTPPPYTHKHIHTYTHKGGGQRGCAREEPEGRIGKVFGCLWLRVTKFVRKFSLRGTGRHYNRTEASATETTRLR